MPFKLAEVEKELENLARQRREGEPVKYVLKFKPYEYNMLLEDVSTHWVSIRSTAGKSSDLKEWI